MSTDVFKACFSDFKNVKTRKVVQLIFEVPSEMADAAMATLGGVPQAHQEIWVAIARIDPTKAASEPRRLGKEPSERERQKWRELAPAKQAAIRCQDAAFQRFLIEHYSFYLDSGQTVEDAVRKICGVTSRADILENTRAEGAWRWLDDQFLAWKDAG